jgi:hypothetical protein
MFTLGVVAQMIIGMSARMVPAFGGVQRAFPRLIAWAAVLLNVAVVLRALEIVAATGFPSLLRLQVLGGPLAYVALLLWGISTWATLNRRRAPAPSTMPA